MLLHFKLTSIWIKVYIHNNLLNSALKIYKTKFLVKNNLENLSRQFNMTFLYFIFFLWVINILILNYGFNNNTIVSSLSFNSSLEINELFRIYYFLGKAQHNGRVVFEFNFLKLDILIISADSCFITFTLYFLLLIVFSLAYACIYLSWAISTISLGAYFAVECFLSL